MDREPFAVVRDGYLFVAGEPTAEAEAPFEIMGLEEMEDRIRSAFEARVKEEVRKAVEEFRERAAVRVSEGGGSNWLANEVRLLSTEPEVK